MNLAPSSLRCSRSFKAFLVNLGLSAVIGATLFIPKVSFLHPKRGAPFGDAAMFPSCFSLGEPYFFLIISEIGISNHQQQVPAPTLRPHVLYRTDLADRDLFQR